jgi:DNA repair exonuclease SbcCD nuclease subunit
MKLIHIADPHLGYRAYNRITPGGLNAREADVFAAFRGALDKAATLEPDLVLIAGDLFHTVRPSNLIVNYSYRQFAAFRKKCSAPIVIIGGNHDTPRSADTGCILDLLDNLPDVYVVHSEYQQVKLDRLDTSVFCLCHRALPQLSSLKIEPDPESKYNILMAHGTVQGIARHAYDLYEISRSQVINDEWDYIAFGHYHVFEQLAPNAFYAGSLEYTSNNIWMETKHDKGFIEYNVEERRIVAFHKVKTREVVDLRPIDAQGVSADQINRMILQRLESIPGGHVNKIVRLVVENIPRSVQADLDFAMIRVIRSEALHFELQLRPPGKEIALGQLSYRLGAPKPLEDEWQEFAEAYNIPGGVDRDRFLALGREYIMKQAQIEE